MNKYKIQETSKLDTFVWNHQYLDCSRTLSSLRMTIQFSSVQSFSRVRLCNPMNCSTPGLPVHYQLPEFTQTRPLSQWCHPAISSSVVPFSSCPQSLPASESFPMCWSFSFSIIPSNEIPGLISFRMDWLDLLAVQGTLKSLLQHHSSKAFPFIPLCLQCPQHVL